MAWQNGAVPIGYFVPRRFTHGDCMLDVLREISHREYAIEDGVYTAAQVINTWLTYFKVKDLFCSANEEVVLLDLNGEIAFNVSTLHLDQLPHLVCETMPMVNPITSEEHRAFIILDDLQFMAIRNRIFEARACCILGRPISVFDMEMTFTLSLSMILVLSENGSRLANKVTVGQATTLFNAHIRNHGGRYFSLLNRRIVDCRRLELGRALRIEAFAIGQLPHIVYRALLLCQHDNHDSESDSSSEVVVACSEHMSDLSDSD